MTQAIANACNVLWVKLSSLKKLLTTSSRPLQPLLQGPVARRAWRDAQRLPRAHCATLRSTGSILVQPTRAVQNEWIEAGRAIGSSYPTLHYTTSRSEMGLNRPANGT